MTAIRDRESRGRATVDRAIDTSSGTSIDLADAFPEPHAPQPYHPAGPSVPRDGALQPNRTLPDVTGRMQNIASDDQGYAREYRLRLLHRFLLRNLPLDMISRSMDLTITEITEMRRELYRRLKLEAGNVDMLTHSGRTLSFYDEIRGQALKMASDGNKTDSVRVKALGVCLQAEKDKHSFLKDAGFYETVKFHPKSGASDAQAGQADSLSSIAKSILDPSSDLSAIADLEQLSSEEALMEEAFFGITPQDDVCLL